MNQFNGAILIYMYLSCFQPIKLPERLLTAGKHEITELLQRQRQGIDLPG